MRKGLLIGVLALLMAATAQAQGPTLCGGALPFDGVIAGGDYTLSSPCASSDTFIIDDTVTITGGGIDAGGSHRIFTVEGSGVLTLNGVTLTGGADPNGAAIFTEFGSTVTISNSALIGNVASDAGNANGGAILSQGTLTILNTTISGNSADYGGAILSAGDVTITHATIAGNTTVNTGSAALDGGTMILRNSIVSDNSGERNCANDIVDAGGNMESVFTCDFTESDGSFGNTDPLLGAFSGGFYPLQASSPAIDAVSCVASRDQNGKDRPQGDACDIGAIEMNQVFNPDTGEVEIVPPEVPAGPPINEWNGDEDTLGWGMDDSVYGTVHMQNGAWQYNVGGVPQSLIDYGVIVAVDVWEQGGDQVFDGYEKICLRGEGRIIFLDATTAPRQQTEILPVTFEEGYTCGWIPNAGTVVLIEPDG